MKLKKNLAISVCVASIAVSSLLAFGEKASAAKTEEVTCDCPQDVIFVSGLTDEKETIEDGSFIWWAKRSYPSSEFLVAGNKNNQAFEARQNAIKNKIVNGNVKGKHRKVLLVGHSMGAVLAQNIADELSYLVDKNTKKPCVEAIPVDAPLYSTLGEVYMYAPIRFIARNTFAPELALMDRAEENLRRNQINWTNGIFADHVNNGGGIHSPWDYTNPALKDPAKAAKAKKQIAELELNIAYRKIHRCDPVTAKLTADKQTVKVGETVNLSWKSTNAKICTDDSGNFDTLDKPNGKAVGIAEYQPDGKDRFRLTCFRDSASDIWPSERASDMVTVNVVDDSVPTPSPIPGLCSDQDYEEYYTKAGSCQNVVLCWDPSSPSYHTRYECPAPTVTPTYSPTATYSPVI